MLQKVLSSRTPPRRHSPPVLSNGAEDCEFGIQVFAERHYAGDVAAAVAVVWSRPDSYDVFIFEMIL